MDHKAKTALELPVEDWQRYHPARRAQATLGGRWMAAWDVARAAARLLREDFAAQRVVVFGSLTHQAWFGPASDIDLAAWGIPDDQYYRAVAAVTGISPDFKVDLVDPDSCQESLRRVIEKEGIEI